MSDIENLQNTIQEILQRITRVESKIDGYNNLREKLDNTSKAVEVHEEKIKTLDVRIAKIEGNNVWLWRTIGAAIVISFIGAFLVWKV